jgi:hypothetical protein
VGGVQGGSYWPAGVPTDPIVGSFIQLFRRLGYEPCGDGVANPQLEKVAIYVKDGLVTHTARQFPGGPWTSKLGSNYDVTHESPEELEQGRYGLVVSYLARPVMAIRPPLHAQPGQ